MARNIQLQLLRGLKANMPPLGLGELYLATDEVQLYVGTSTGNKLIFGNTQGIGSGPAGQAVTTKKLGTGSGPTNPTTVVNYIKIILNGTTFWIPLMQ